jgi:hypothetical protein
MEEVLEIYHRPYDDEYPVVGLDESNKQLVGKIRPPIPANQVPQRVDDEYVRNGVVRFIGADG